MTSGAEIATVINAVLKHIRLVRLAATAVIWATVVEPLFSHFPALAALGGSATQNAYVALGVHVALAFLLVSMGGACAEKALEAYEQRAAKALERLARQQQFANRAQIFTTCDADEKVILRAFIDKGARTLSAGALERELADAVDNGPHEIEGLREALQRLRHRNIVSDNGAEPFRAGAMFFLHQFAFLSEHPELVDSQVQPRIVAN